MNKTKKFKEAGHEGIRIRFVNEIRRGNHKRVQEFLIIHGCQGGCIIKKVHLI